MRTHTQITDFLRQHVIFHAGGRLPVISCVYCTAGSNPAAVDSVIADRCGTPPGCHIEAECGFCHHVQPVCHTELYPHPVRDIALRACADIAACRARSHLRNHAPSLAYYDIECELCTAGASLAPSLNLIEHMFDALDELDLGTLLLLIGGPQEPPFTFS
jgi:hypothetical protein